MKYKVIGVDDLYRLGLAGYDYHLCEDKDGRVHKIDTMIGGDLDINIGAKDLIGKNIEIRELTTYVSIGHGVRIVE